MSYLEYNTPFVPTGLKKILYVNWALVVLISAVAAVGCTVLFSVTDGDYASRTGPQLQRFGLGFGLMLVIAMVPIWFWRNMSAVVYLATILLLLAVALFGVELNGSKRWLDIQFMLFQPSELMKISLVAFLAAYYDWLPARRVSRPLWVLIPMVIVMVPVVMVREQPDLGTALAILVGGGTLMFIAGVHWAYFAALVGTAAAGIWAVFASRGTTWQILENYQYRRIDTFFDPALDPAGAGYHITQAKIALGSGGWTGRGFMQGTQSRLEFLPEPDTDFIFNTLAEEFGFWGGIALLLLYSGIVLICFATALTNRNRFAALLTLGIAVTFFFAFALNLAMVMGLAPVVGLPLPLVSWGGSSMLVLMVAFGLVQSAHVHKAR